MALQEISIAAALLTIIVMALGILILMARSRLVPSGNVTIGVNGERDLTVPVGDKLLNVLTAQKLFYGAIDFGEDRHTFWLTGLEQFFNPRQTARDVHRAGNSTRVERTHGQLSARLADALRCDDAGGFSKQHLLAVGQ